MSGRMVRTFPPIMQDTSRCAAMIRQGSEDDSVGSPSPYQRISALIARGYRHNAVASPRDEWLLRETQMGLLMPCVRVAVVLHRSNRGRAAGGHAALDGRRAGRRAAAARHPRIRCMDGRARAGSGEAENRSAQIALAARCPADARASAISIVGPRRSPPRRAREGNTKRFWSGSRGQRSDPRSRPCPSGTN